METGTATLANVNLDHLLDKWGTFYIKTMNKEVNANDVKTFVASAREKSIPEVNILKTIAVTIGNSRKSLYSLMI